MRGIFLGLMALAVCGCSGNQPSAKPSSSLPVNTQAPPTKAVAAPPTKTAVAPAPPPPARPTIDPEALAVVREYTQMFYRGEVDLLHAKFTSEMRETLTLEQLSTLYEHVVTSYGKETSVIQEDSQRNEEYRAFVRFAHFEKIEDIIELQWILPATNDDIAGFFIRPAQRRIDATGRQ